MQDEFEHFHPKNPLSFPIITKQKTNPLVTKGWNVVIFHQDIYLKHPSQNLMNLRRFLNPPKTASIEHRLKS